MTSCAFVPELTHNNYAICELFDNFSLSAMKIAKPSNWKTAPLPERQTAVTLDRSFTAEEINLIRQGLIPQEMEDKWFIYWQDNALHFHRSWTGNCIYVVQFAAEGEGYRMVSAAVNRDPEQYKETNDEHDRQMISYLIDVLLLRRPSAFPSSDASPPMQSLQKWSQVGRAMLGQHPDNPQE
jgi:hypothetical protein